MFRDRSAQRLSSLRSLSTITVLAFMAGVGCGGGEELVDGDGDGIADGVVDPNNVTVVTPTRPTGYVAGEVRDAVNDEPLSGVEVTLAAGGLPEGFESTITTDPSGTFEFGPIAAGASFAMRGVVDGYASVHLSDLIIDDSAGDFPTSNAGLFIGPLRLLRTVAAFDVQVVSAEGRPVPAARVTVETAARYLWAETPRGHASASAQTDADGFANVQGLPDIWSLPPRYESAGTVTVSVDPVDEDGDGVVDWAGATRTLAGRTIREQGRGALVVLQRPVQDALQPIAANVEGVLRSNAPPAVLAVGEPVRIVFNKPVDRDGIVIDLRDEEGEVSLVPTVVVGSAGNVVEIGSATGLDAGKEYNLSLRVQALDVTPLDTYTRATPFFVRDVRDRAITVTGQFIDGNGDSQWGSGNDNLRVELSTPLGSPDARPAFSVELYVAMDLNGSTVLGDAPGELPPSGADYPSPIILEAAEPTPPNGAGRSGFTRFMSERRINLQVPLTNPAVSVDFEVRFPLSRNGGAAVTTPTGREVPPRLSGTLFLMGS